MTDPLMYIYDSLKKENPNPLEVGDVVKSSAEYSYSLGWLIYGKIISPETYRERTGKSPGRLKAIKKGNNVCIKLRDDYVVLPARAVVKIDPADEIAQIRKNVEEDIVVLEWESDKDISFLESLLT